MKIFLPVYALALLLIAPHLSLWLDEILTLIGAVEPTTSALLEYIKTVPGGTPLAFLVPRWSIDVLGNSQLGARLPSILSSMAACLALYKLACRLNLRSPLLAVAIFALWPLQFRYALEARPYALALALSLWSTEFFLAKRTAPYILVTLLASLAQPYALFVAAAHAVYAFLSDRPALRTPLIAMALSALALFPWYAHFQSDWSHVTAAPFDPRSPLVFLREISGSGYLGSAILIAAIAVARPNPRDVLVLLAIVPLLAVFAGNAALHYFFATRQLIYILPAIVLIVCRSKVWILQAAFLAACIYSDVTWVLKPREDWRAAADALQREVAYGACVEFVGDSTPLYNFLNPDLGKHPCSPTSDRIALALTPYGGNNPIKTTGLHKQSEQLFEGPGVAVYTR